MGAKGAYNRRGGFTLIELSIVLVIIGLIVGGVLAGQNLIAAAAVRAQISQIEKYKTAANTFFGKYGALPGDIQPSLVTQFNFTADPTRNGTAGTGDGNGELDGVNGSTAYAWNQNGEIVYFWEDLSTNSGLIEGGFNSSIGSASTNCSTLTACSKYFPAAKIGGNNSVYVYSGYAKGCCSANTGIGPNFFGLSVLTSLYASNVSLGSNGVPPPGLTVSQAYAIDTKTDDGLPTSGNVLAQYLGGAGGSPTWSGNAVSPSATTCYDTTSNSYSISQSNGANVNCALSFRLQAGD